MPNLVEVTYKQAKGLEDIGYLIKNDVVFNQVLVAVEDDDKTTAILDYLQKTGKLWLGGSTWNGKPVIRVSISSWRTNEMDIKKTVEIFEEAKKACADRG